MILLNVLSMLVISMGAFFLLIGSVGLLRFPDFFTRAHAQGKADTLGVILIILGLILSLGFTLVSFKLLLILAFVGLTNPTGTNALTRAAYRFRQTPWFKGDKEQKNEEKD